MSKLIRIVVCSAMFAGIGLLELSASPPAEAATTFHGRFVSAYCYDDPFSGVSGTWNLIVEKTGPQFIYALFLAGDLHAVITPPISWSFEPDSNASTYHIPASLMSLPGVTLEVWLVPSSGDLVLHITGVPVCPDFTAYGATHA